METSWIKEFKDNCEEMLAKNEIQKFFPDRGKIIIVNQVCEKCGYDCIFFGSDLECGNFYECGFAKYCPKCKEIFDVRDDVNFAVYDQKSFLPIMKKKLLGKKLDTSLTKGLLFDTCPICGWITHSFHKDLGGIDYFDNYWIVCVNPDCDWSGEHWENYEHGPY